MARCRNYQFIVQTSNFVRAIERTGKKIACLEVSIKKFINPDKVQIDYIHMDPVNMASI